jgi:putative endopeptidase
MEGQELQTLNPVFQQSDEDDEMVDVQQAHFLPTQKKSVRRGISIKRFRLYIGYCCSVLIIFGIVLTFLFLKYDTLSSTFSTFDLKNHNYSVLVNNYDVIATQMFAAMNVSANPCEDFYNYACGNWMANTNLGTDTARMTKAFSAVESSNLALLQQILEEDWPAVTPYFRSCNESYQLGNFSSIFPFYQQLENASTSDDLFKSMAMLRTVNGLDLATFAFTFAPIADLYNPTVRIATVSQATLPLPGPDYYIPSIGLINEQEYYRYIISMFALSPHPIGIDEAIAIYAYEAAVSKLLVNGNRAQDPSQLYRKVQWGDMRNFLPREVMVYLINFNLIPTKQMNNLNIETLDFFTAYNDLLRGLDFKILKNVALYSLFRSTYPLLGAQYYDTQKGLYSMLEGVSHKAQSLAAREKMCVSVVATDLKLLMGHYFVKAAQIDETFKQHVNDIIENLQAAFAIRIENNTWMDAMTKSSAEGKLSAMRKQICYPDDWNGALEFEQNLGAPLDAKNFFSNALRLSFTTDKMAFNSLGRLINPNEWSFDAESPAIVNAFYSPDFNRITIPAGITRPPFLYSYTWRNAPFSSIYGGIGAVVGHEITHGYDNLGRRFAADGAYVNWWTIASDNAFSVAAQCVSNFYDHLETQVPDLYVDGALTLGENIADMGGLETAFDAFLAEKALLNDVDHTDYENALSYVFPKLSDAQLFFIFYAQNWCEKATDDSVRELVESNPHAPAAQRVKGVLMNMPRFAETFSCGTGNGYVPPDRCKVW